MTRNNKPADVFQCEVEVVFDDWDETWAVELRVRPRVRHPIGRPYHNKPDALCFANTLARDLSIPVRVLEKK